MSRLATRVEGAPKVRIRDLHKQFVLRGRTVEALAGIDLDIRSGEFFCVVGPSGCGKTTLLRILAGLESSTTGTIEIGRDSDPASSTRQRTAPERPLTSMVFQEQSIFPWMTVRDNVAFGLKAQGLNRAQRYALARPVIAQVGLDGFDDALPHQLSGGMKQRVSIARALATDPEILLMDEPFAALDEQTKLILQSELLRVWDHTRKTVVYVTHSIDEAIMLADRVLVMTGRPGRTKDLVDVADAFGRPRQVEAVRSSTQYGELFARVWGQLRDEVLTRHQAWDDGTIR